MCLILFIFFLFPTVVLPRCGCIARVRAMRPTRGVCFPPGGPWGGGGTVAQPEPFCWCGVSLASDTGRRRPLWWVLLLRMGCSMTPAAHAGQRHVAPVAAGTQLIHPHCSTAFRARASFPVFLRHAITTPATTARLCAMLSPVFHTIPAHLRVAAAQNGWVFLQCDFNSTASYGVHVHTHTNTTHNYHHKLCFFLWLLSSCTR